MFKADGDIGGRKKDMNKRYVKIIFLSVFCFLLSFYVFYSYVPIIKNDVKNDELLLNYTVHDSECEYAGNRYVEISFRLEDYYRAFNYSKRDWMFQDCFLKVKEKMESQEVFSKRYYTLRECDSIYHNFAIGDSLLLTTCDAEDWTSVLDEDIYLNIENRMPEFSVQNIKSIKIYSFGVYDHFYSGVEALLYDARTQYLSERNLDLLDSKTEEEFIASFLNEFKSEGNLIKLREKLNKEYQKTSISFGIEFKDKAFPFEILLTEKTIVGVLTK